MSRSRLGDGITDNWDDGDHPGAGPKGADSTGLNGTLTRHGTAITAEHETNGVHKANIIDGPNLKTTVADGITIELRGSPLKLTLKFLGITADYIANGAITAAKLANSIIDTASKIADRAIPGSKIALGTILGENIAAHTITADKLFPGTFPGYLEYVAILNQSGTGHPVAQVLLNTFGGPIIWTRFSQGVFQGHLLAHFPIGKTIVFILGGTNGPEIPVSNSYNLSAQTNLTADDVAIIVYNNQTNALSDNGIVNASIMIRVYP